MSQSGPRKRPAVIAYHLVWNFVDWVFPPRCGGCDQFGERWCTDCQQKAIRLTEPCCDCCGLPQNQSGFCVQCRSQPPTFNALRSWCAYKENSRQAIHRLKYSRDVGLAEALAQQVCQLAGSLSWPVDVVTSVPLNPARLKQRGYNQSSLLGLPVALALGVAFRPGLLSRTRDTATQVGLSAEERKNNVKGAFSAGLSTGRNVLIIDDVITTGATMNACALALRSAGASSVYGLSFARALLSDDQVRSDPIS